MPDYGSHINVCRPRTVSNPLIHALEEENEPIDFEKERVDCDLSKLSTENDHSSAESQAFLALKEECEQLKFKEAKSKQRLLTSIVLVEGLKKGNDELRAQLQAGKKHSKRVILAGKALIKKNDKLKAEIEDAKHSHSMLASTKEELEARVRQLKRAKLKMIRDLKLGIKEGRALESRVCQLEDDNGKLKRELLMESMHAPRRGEDLTAVRKAWSRTDMQEQ